MGSILSRALFALILMVALLCAPAALSAQGQSFIQFDSEETIELDWSSFAADGADVVVLNNTGVERDLTAVVSDITLDTVDDGELAASVVVVTPTVRLASMATVKLELSAATASATPKPGTYTGYLSVSDSQAAFTIHRPIELVVAAPGASNPAALVSSWSVTAYRLALLSRIPRFNEHCEGWICLSTGDLPVTAEAAGMQFKGTLASDAGGMVTAWTTTTTRTLSASPGSPYAGALMVPLRFDHLDGPGTYSGTITADPADDDSQIALSVLVTHDPFWPILVMFLSGALAILFYHYREGHLLKRQELSRDVAALEEAYRAAKYPRLAGPPPNFRDYDIHDDLMGHRQGLRAGIRNLSRAIIRLDGDPDYQQLRKEADAHKATIEQWATFPEALEQLEQGLKLVDDKNSPPQGLLGSGRALLVGGSLALRDVPGVLSSITGTTELANTWVALRNQYSEVRRKFLALHRNALRGSGPKVYDRAAMLLNECYAELGRVKTSGELEALNTRADLLSAESLVDRLSVLPGSGVVGAVADAGNLSLPEFVPSSRGLPGVAAAQPAVLPAQAAVARADAIIRSWNWWFFVATVLVAIFTGLQTFYFGKAFGTLVDYINVALWAFTATALLETIVSSLGHVLAGMPNLRLRLP